MRQEDLEAHIRTEVKRQANGSVLKILVGVCAQLLVLIWIAGEWKGSLETKIGQHLGPEGEHPVVRAQINALDKLAFQNSQRINAVDTTLLRVEDLLRELLTESVRKGSTTLPRNEPLR